MAQKILVVEDHSDTRMLVSMVLQSEGYQVLEAGDGNEAFMHIESGFCPSMVLADLRMPGCDGQEFVERFRQRAGCELVPVIFTSGAVDVEEAARTSGAQGYLEKPIDLRTLVQTVKSTLKNFAEAAP